LYTSRGDVTTEKHDMDKEHSILLTVSQASDLMGCSRSLGYAMAKRSQIPTVSLGPRSLRVPRKALEAWVSEQLLRQSMTAGGVEPFGVPGGGSNAEGEAMPRRLVVEEHEPSGAT
jgi:excisionase family DNA binding protein